MSARISRDSQQQVTCWLWRLHGQLLISSMGRAWSMDVFRKHFDEFSVPLLKNMGKCDADHRISFTLALQMPRYIALVMS
jgi:hypothetical protein